MADGPSQAGRDLGARCEWRDERTRLPGSEHSHGDGLYALTSIGADRAVATEVCGRHLKDLIPSAGATVYPLGGVRATQHVGSPWCANQRPACTGCPCICHRPEIPVTRRG